MPGVGLGEEAEGQERNISHLYPAFRFVPNPFPPLFPQGIFQSCDIQRNLHAPHTFSTAHPRGPEITSQALQNYKIGLKAMKIL